jgi:hypothetical protein
MKIEGTSGVKVTKIYGRNSNEIKDGIDIGSIYENDERTFMIEIDTNITDTDVYLDHIRIYFIARFATDGKAFVKKKDDVFIITDDIKLTECEPQEVIDRMKIYYVLDQKKNVLPGLLNARNKDNAAELIKKYMEILEPVKDKYLDASILYKGLSKEIIDIANGRYEKATKTLSFFSAIGKHSNKTYIKSGSYIEKTH